MRNFIVSASYVSLCCLTSQALAQAHPLEGAVKALAKVSSELSAARQNSDSADFALIDQLHQQTARLWSDAIALPVQATDPALAQLGFAFKDSDDPSNYQPTLIVNDNIKTLHSETYALKTDLLTQLNTIVSSQLQLEDEAEKMIGSPDFNTGIDIAMQDSTMRRVVRGSGLHTIQEEANRELSCVNYFAPTLKADGLIPVNTGSGYAWSVDDLLRVYGRPSLNQLTGSAKDLAIKSLTELTDQAAQTGLACIPQDKFDFMYSELKKLQP